MEKTIISAKKSFYPSQFQYVFESAIREDLSIINQTETDEIPKTVIDNYQEDWKEIDCLLKIYYWTELPEVARFRLIK